MNSSMLHWSETWSMKRKHKTALPQAAIRIIRWMCAVRLRDKLSCVPASRRVGTEDVATVVQWNRLRWCGYVLRNGNEDCPRTRTNFSIIPVLAAATVYQGLLSHPSLSVNYWAVVGIEELPRQRWIAKRGLTHCQQHLPPLSSFIAYSAGALLCPQCAAGLHE